jgi:hypothetical protein
MPLTRPAFVRMNMRVGIPAEGFLRHKGLILVTAGGAVAEAGLLTFVAPAARPIAPQVTALPVLAAYHDLRWLFADSQSWLGFAAVMVATLLARSAVDTVLLRLAWPREVEMPTVGRTFWSCLALTALAWLLLSPAATLAFGVAVLPFSWPFLAALPIMLGITLALSHGGAIVSWWRRLPPLRSVLWLLSSFVMLSTAAAVIVHLPTAAALAVAAVTGVVNARAWYGIATVASRLHPRPHASMPARVLLGLPFAPLAAIMVLVLVVGVARLMFTGTIQLAAPSASAAVANAADGTGPGDVGPGGANAAPAAASTAARAVLVVAGWGTWCCDAGNALHAATPGIMVRQFSYAGMTATGQPLRSGPKADDLPLPVLGDRIAAQLMRLHDITHGRVDIVAESEGTLGVYAMLDRHPDLPIGSVVLLSPIVEPGQMSYSPGQDGASVSEYALDELNHLVGGMSPYGPSGAQLLLSSVSQFGAQYFDHLARDGGGTIRWLTVVPLADALTLPVCELPPDVILVPAFHGGLLGDSSVLPMVAEFLTGHPAVPKGQDESRLRTEAELLTGAAVAWRMPQTDYACP